MSNARVVGQTVSAILGSDGEVHACPGSDKPNDLVGAVFGVLCAAPGWQSGTNAYGRVTCAACLALLRERGLFAPPEA